MTTLMTVVGLIILAGMALACWVLVSSKKTYWEYDEEYDYWQCKECDLHWTMLDGTPEENGMQYCPQCGRRIVEFKGGSDDG